MNLFKDGALVEFSCPGFCDSKGDIKYFDSIWGHLYKDDNRNPHYVHPLGPSCPDAMALPPNPWQFRTGLVGIVIRSLPVTTKWHQGGEIDYVVLVDDQLMVIPDCSLKALKEKDVEL